MKKTITFLILLFAITTIVAQQDCGVICHNGTLLTGVNESAVEGHLIHGDVFITNDCNYIETGNECESLSLPKFNINKDYPLNLSYKIYDIKGSLLVEGLTFSNMKYHLPERQILIMRVEGYQTLKIIR